MRRLCTAAFVALFLLQSSASAYGASLALKPLTEIRIPKSLSISIAQDWLTSHAVVMALLQTRSAMQSSAPDFRSAPRQTPIDPARVRETPRIKPTYTGSGVRLPGPPMLHEPLSPQASKRLAPATRPMSTSAKPAAHGISAQSVRTQSVTIGSPNNTGINHWWAYEEGAIPGAGKYMVNVANANLIVQSDDMDVPERGIDLAFRRTYNSMSMRDWGVSGGSGDGSPTPGMYGSGWTNTFDAHIAANSAGGISVFDIDGARYDYTPSGAACLTPPAGQFATLCYDGVGAYNWGKKTGTVYAFYVPTQPANYAAYAGRLAGIYARNYNNNIRFVYSWAGGDASTTLNLTQIQAQHSDGHALTLNFGSINNIRLLASLVRPDGATVSYTYDASNRLTFVYEIPNNSAGTQPLLGYGWNGYSQMAWATSPRYNNSGGGEGGYSNFSYDGSNNLTQVGQVGVMNFVPNDGTGTQIQPGISTGLIQFYSETFARPTGETQLTDTDGHATNWFYDGVGRVTQTQEWSGSLWLMTGASWDNDNNLTETTDARGNPTDYAYDAFGNSVAIALPAVSTNQGTFRPTTLLSYDRTNSANNIVAYCDPVRSHSLNQDWITNPGTSDSLCPNGPGSVRYGIDYSDPSEPFGKVISTITASGYLTTIAYDPSSQAGVDAGLPTSVTGTSFGQLDGSNVTPQQTFVYNSFGDLTSYNPGNGAWSLTYDSQNKPSAATDADGVTIRTCYYTNGLVRAKQSAAQFALDGGVTCGANSVNYAYDLDGNQISDTRHYDGGADVTRKWYDGADRLVEAQPPGALTRSARYKYDLSQGGTVSISGSNSFKAYGNLFATAVNVGSWLDSRGQSFDALDRSTSIYRYRAGASLPFQTTSVYDTNSTTWGLLVSRTDGLGEVTSYSYDAAGHTTGVSFQNDGGITPSRVVTIDANGQPTSLTSSSGTRSYSYDSDGRLTSASQTNAGFSGTTISYNYYANGWRSDLSASGPYVSQNQLLSYSYRADGQRKTESFSYGGSTRQFHWVSSSAGRETSFTDPYATRQKTYDPYGRLATDALQQGSYANFRYNPEGGVTGYTSFGGQTASLSYDAINGLVGESFAPGGTGWPNGGIGGCAGPIVCDDLNQSAVSENDAGGNWTRSKTWQYDGAGRQTVNTSMFDGSAPCINPHYEGFTCYADGAATQSSRFDAENRLIGNAVSRLGLSDMAMDICPIDLAAAGQINQVHYTPPAPPNVTPSIFYGPDGRLVKDGGEQIYWDGGEPLFTVTAGGALDDIKIDGFAVFAASQSRLTIIDRDFSGAQISQHNDTGYGPWGPPDPYHTSCQVVQVGGTTGFVGMSESISQPGADGIYDGVNIFQGARAYDPTVKQWTAPDVYPGDVNDPMSQRPYMWNRNNPIVYKDPSGYTSYLGFIELTPSMAFPTSPFELPPILHGFIEVKNPEIHDGGGVFEAGPSILLLLKDQSYNDHVKGGAHPDRLSYSLALNPPKGMSQTAWDAKVYNTFKSLTEFLQRHEVPYGVVNSNTFIAEGLRRLGYSAKDIQKMMNSPAGVSPGSGGAFIDVGGSTVLPR